MVNKYQQNNSCIHWVPTLRNRHSQYQSHFTDGGGKHSEVKSLAYSHTAGEWQSWDYEPRLSNSKF